MYRTACHYLERLAFAVLIFGGIGMVISTALGTADVIGTQFLKHPVPGALEITSSTMVLIVFGSLTYAQVRRAHIRVELVYSRMGPRGKAAMEIISDLAALLFFGILLWQAIGEAQFSLQIGEATDGLIRFPLYPARIVLATGTALLLVRLALDLFDHFGDLIAGTVPLLYVDPALVNPTESGGDVGKP